MVNHMMVYFLSGTYIFLAIFWLVFTYGVEARVTELEKQVKLLKEQLKTDSDYQVQENLAYGVALFDIKRELTKDMNIIKNDLEWLKLENNYPLVMQTTKEEKTTKKRTVT